jgi:DNA-directed RNA polymerase subunit RPC12/RpoP
MMLQCEECGIDIPIVLVDDILEQHGQIFCERCSERLERAYLEHA